MPADCSDAACTVASVEKALATLTRRSAPVAAKVANMPLGGPPIGRHKCLPISRASNNPPPPPTIEQTATAMMMMRPSLLHRSLQLRQTPGMETANRGAVVG